MRTFETYLGESVWTDAKKKFDPELVNEFQRRLTNKQLKPNKKDEIPNIQRMKSEEELKDHVDASIMEVPYNIFKQIKQEQKDGSKLIFKNNKCKIYQCVNVDDLDKYSNHNNIWCLIDDPYHWEEHYKREKIYVVVSNVTGKNFLVHHSYEQKDEGEEPTNNMFPFCITVSREGKRFEGWDSANNGLSSTPYYLLWIKKRVLEPLKIPLEIFK